MYPYLDVLGRSIPSYGLCMAIGMLLSCYVGFIRARKYNLDTNSLIVIAACAIGMGLLGAKMLYLLVTNDIKDILSRLLHGDISVLTGSGQVFYGGLIGGAMGTLLGARIAGETDKLALYCQAAVPAVPLGHAIGRIGCFLAGCCYGAPYTGFGAVTFPMVGVAIPVFPIQLLEAALNLLIFVLLILPWKKGKFFSLSFYLLLYSVVRFVLEFFRGDAIRGITQGLSTSQWVSIGLFICGFILLTVNKKQEKVAMQ